MNSKYPYTNGPFQKWFDNNCSIHNMSQEDVASKLGITFSQMSHIYVGTRPLCRYHVLAMMKIFHSKEIPEDLYQQFNI